MIAKIQKNSGISTFDLVLTAAGHFPNHRQEGTTEDCAKNHTLLKQML